MSSSKKRSTAAVLAPPARVRPKQVPPAPESSSVPFPSATVLDGLVSDSLVSGSVLPDSAVLGSMATANDVAPPGDLPAEIPLTDRAVPVLEVMAEPFAAEPFAAEPLAAEPLAAELAATESPSPTEALAAEPTPLEEVPTSPVNYDDEGLGEVLIEGSIYRFDSGKQGSALCLSARQEGVWHWSYLGELRWDGRDLRSKRLERRLLTQLSESLRQLAAGS